MQYKQQYKQAKKMNIEGDNKNLIQVVNEKIQVPWKIQVLVQDI